MTEKKKNLSEFTPFEFSSADKKVIGIVVSEWNDRITDSLLNGAKESLLEHGVLEENILVKYVPGSFELPLGAKWMLFIILFQCTVAWICAWFAYLIANAVIA